MGSNFCTNCGNCHLPQRCAQRLTTCTLCNQQGHSWNFCCRGASTYDAEYKYFWLCANCDCWHLPAPCQHHATTCSGCGQVGHLQYFCPMNPLPRNALTQLGPPPVAQLIGPRSTLPHDPPTVKDPPAAKRARKAPTRSKKAKAAAVDTPQAQPSQADQSMTNSDTSMSGHYQQQLSAGMVSAPMQMVHGGAEMMDAHIHYQPHANHGFDATVPYQSHFLPQPTPGQIVRSMPEARTPGIPNQGMWRPDQVGPQAQVSSSQPPFGIKLKLKAALTPTSVTPASAALNEYQQLALGTLPPTTQSYSTTDGHMDDWAANTQQPHAAPNIPSRVVEETREAPDHARAITNPSSGQGPTTDGIASNDQPVQNSMHGVVVNVPEGDADEVVNKAGVPDPPSKEKHYVNADSDKGTNNDTFRLLASALQPPPTAQLAPNEQTAGQTWSFGALEEGQVMTKEQTQSAQPIQPAKAKAAKRGRPPKKATAVDPSDMAQGASAQASGTA